MLIGIFWGKDQQKTAWLMVLGGMFLFSLGRSSGFHYLLFKAFPPFGLLRNTHSVFLYLGMGAAYFYVLGCNYLVYHRPSGTS